MSVAVAPTGIMGSSATASGFSAVVAGSRPERGLEALEPAFARQADLVVGGGVAEPRRALEPHRVIGSAAVEPSSADANGQFQASPPPLVGLFWDLNSCGPPNGKSRSEVTAMDWERTARSVRSLGESLGPVARFTAYLGPDNGSAAKDAAKFKDAERRALAAAGAELVEAPVSIALDLAFFAVDHQVPATVVLLAGEGSHGEVLQRLRNRSYKVVVVSNLQQSAAMQMQPQPQPQQQLPLKLPQALPFQSRAPQTAAAVVQGGPGIDLGGPQQKKGPAPVTRQSLRDLTAFLEGHPQGLDGPAVASWLQLHIPGGPGTFGFPRLRPFLDAAHQAGVLYLSASAPGPDAPVRVFPPGPTAASVAAAAAGGPASGPPPQPRGAWAATAAAPPPPSAVASAAPAAPGRMAVSRRTLVPLVRFLESNPRGVDGGEVSKLLRENFGGFGAFGYDRLKSFLEAADRAGVCRLRAGGSTLWVMPVAPPAPPSHPQQASAAAVVAAGDPQRVPSSPGPLRSPSGGRRGNNVSGDIFIELRKYLQGFPGGVDGGVLNLWLESAVGGYKALGYPRLKPFLQDAEDAGMCRCSTDSGTLWVTPVFSGDAPASSAGSSPASGSVHQPPPQTPPPQSAPVAGGILSSPPPGFLGGLQVDVRASAASALMLGAPGDRRNKAPGAPAAVPLSGSVITPAPMGAPASLGAASPQPQPQQQHWFGPLFGTAPQGGGALMHSPQQQPRPEVFPASPQQQQQQQQQLLLQGAWAMAL